MRKTAKKLNAVGKTETDQPKKVPIKEAKIELEKMQAERADELIKNTRFFLTTIWKIASFGEMELLEVLN